jgi:2-succinyl-6-hydroxy-2,4-cyclohexadiene-1-carboxylate synthase
MPWHETELYRFHYQVQGVVGSPRLLFLHGFMGQGDDFQEVMAALASTFYCVSVDLPGHGQTQVLLPANGYYLDAVAEGLLAFLTAHSLLPCGLVGYSMGGRLALHMACQHPEQFTGLVLESASPGLATAAERHQRRQQDETLAQMLEAESWLHVLQRWYDQPIFASLKQSPSFAALMQRRSANNPQALAQVLRGLGTGQQPSLWTVLPTLQIPITLIVGARDSKFLHMNTVMAASCPSAQLVVLPDCGHTPHYENPQRFITALLAGLSHAA